MNDLTDAGQGVILEEMKVNGDKSIDLSHRIVPDVVTSNNYHKVK